VLCDDLTSDEMNDRMYAQLQYIPWGYWTMTKTAVISARIEPDLKQSAEEVFRELGLTTTQAIILFYKQVELERGLPFLVRIPNEVTAEALEQARTRRDLEGFNTLEDLFADLGI